METNQILSRRRFVAGSAGTSLLLGLGDLPGLQSLPHVSAAEMHQVASAVRFASDVEPTLRLLEETPRDQVLEVILERTSKDLSYRELVAALLLAGVHNIPGSSPRHHRNVGGALHGVFVVYSAHRTSLNCSAQQRWLPILFAVDQFKRWQTDDRGLRSDREQNWQMSALPDTEIPAEAKAHQAFQAALDDWDEEAAERAAASLARASGAHRVFELLSRYAVRDYRYIGHKTIFVANAWRTLQFIGWRHAEPVLRSLGRALAAYYHQEGHPARSDNRADRSWRHNLGLLSKLRGDWQDGTIDDAATTNLLAVVREGGDQDASEQVVELINHGTSPRSLWDAIMCGVGEVVMRWPDFNTLHAATTMNAMHYLYQMTQSDQTRKLILLQAAAFATFFRSESNQRVRFDVRVDALDPLEPESSGAETIDEIATDLGDDRVRAARKALAYLARGGDPRSLFERTRQWMLSKGSNAHDYKFGAAVGEDFWSMSGTWRNRQLAASLFLARSPAESDAPVYRQISEIVG